MPEPDSQTDSPDSRDRLGEHSEYGKNDRTTAEVRRYLERRSKAVPPLPESPTASDDLPKVDIGREASVERARLALEKAARKDKLRRPQ